MPQRVKCIFREKSVKSLKRSNEWKESRGAISSRDDDVHFPGN
jgi:hypothetical protein